jgi:hypothetical protein
MMWIVSMFLWLEPSQDHLALAPCRREAEYVLPFVAAIPESWGD